MILTLPMAMQLKKILRYVESNVENIISMCRQYNNAVVYKSTKAGNIRICRATFRTRVTRPC